MSRTDPRAGILAGPIDGPAKAKATYPDLTGTVGMRALHRASRFSGEVVRFERDGVVLKGASGLERVFPFIVGAYEVEGRAVTLIAPKRAKGAPATTASGSLAVADHRAKVARASRILVEGVHDAELVERVWGDDLRVEDVVVERLDDPQLLRIDPMRTIPKKGVNRRLLCSRSSMTVPLPPESSAVLAVDGLRGHSQLAAISCHDQSRARAQSTCSPSCSTNRRMAMPSA